MQQTNDALQQLKDSRVTTEADQVRRIDVKDASEMKRDFRSPRERRKPSLKVSRNST